MPTYVVNAMQNLLTSGEKKQIAQEITRAHSSATGAHGLFAQVIFNEIPLGSHFMGGVLIETKQVYVHGHIRAGRTEAQKKLLLDDVIEAVIKSTGLERRCLWAYISELAPSNMVEYGRVLPRPSSGSQWLEALSQGDREYMLSLGNAQ
jgi:phenylpyruvate tautomerase PptA (4-oxalocrotonate tautomerase family)